MDDLERLRHAEDLRERVILSRTLADRDRQLRAALERVRERDRWIETLRARLTERGLFATWLEAEVKNRDALISELRAALERRAPGSKVHCESNASTALKARFRLVLSVARRGARVVGRVARALFGVRRRGDQTVRSVAPEAPAESCRTIEPEASIEDRARAGNVEEDTTDFNIILRQIPSRQDAYDVWIRNNRWTTEDDRWARQVLATMPSKPLFSIVLVTASDEEAARARADLEAQAAANWELRVIRPHCSASTPGDRTYVDIDVKSLFDAANGDYLLVLDGNLRLSPNAVFAWTLACQNGERPALIFADEDRIDERGRRSNPRFRPGWAPDRLLSELYLGRAVVFRRDVGDRWLDSETRLEDAWRSELSLRVAESGERVVHCPHILFHEMMSDQQDDVSCRIRRIECERRAIERSLMRRGIPAVVGWTREGIRQSRPRFDLRFPTSGPRVTILIPTKDRVDLLRRCVASILERTDYDRFDILILDNGSADPETLRFLASPTPRCRVRRIAPDESGFNFARLMNQGVAAVDYDVPFVLMLNNDTEVLSRDWLAQMVGYGSIAGVGFVGARLLYGDGRVQHAGVMPALFDGEPGHALRFSPWWDPARDDFGSGATNISAVTGACLLARKSTFEQLGGFDETRFAVGYNDVDLCLRGWEAGFRTVLALGVELRHLEGASRGFETDPAESARYRERWGERTDPLQHPVQGPRDESLRFETRRRRHRHLAQRQPKPHRVLIADAESDPTFGERLERALTERPECVVQRAHCESSTQQGMETAVPPGGFLALDVVHAIGAWAFPIVGKARALGLPVVWTIRESVDFRMLYGGLEESARRQAVDAFTSAYRVVFPSNATRRCYQALEAAWNFHVLLEGPDLDSIRHASAEARPAASCPRRILACLDGEEDRLRSFCAAMERLARGEPSTAIGVTARGEAARDLERIGLEFPRLDVLQRMECHAALAASDLVALAVRRDVPIDICVDASAMGKAIVALPVEGAEEYLVSKQGAVLVPRSEPDAFIAAIRELIADPSERRRLGDVARTAARRLPTMTQVAERYLELYLEAVEVDHTPQPDSRAPRASSAA